MIQESAGHPLTGVLTWTAARLTWNEISKPTLGRLEFEKAMRKLKNLRSSARVGSLLAIQEKVRERHLLSLWISVSALVAGVGFEPTTFGL
jgi:hypothetical protein